MGNLVFNGATSGSTTVQPTDAVSPTLTLPSTSGTLALNGPAFSAYASAATTLSTGTWGKIAFQTSLFDTNSNYSTANSRFTPTVAGYYQINATVNFASTASVQQDAIAIYKNGSAYQIGVYVPDTGNYSIRLNMSSLVYCNGTTDYIEIWAVYNAGPSTQAQGYGSNATYFNGFLARTA